VGEIGILVFFILALLILIAYWIRVGSVDTAIAVDDSPSQAVDAVVSYMVLQGFAISHRDDTSATFTRTKGPNTDIGCLLLLLGIVPGLLYFGLFKGTWTTTVLATTGAAGTQLMISGDDRRAQTSLRRWARAEIGTDETAVSLEKPEREPCWKCGSRTTLADVRCPTCGAWLRLQTHEGYGHPVHQTARVPTPEADVPVPPPPQRETGAQPLEQAEAQPRGPWTTGRLVLGC
jgi:hypothetical protein